MTRFIAFAFTLILLVACEVVKTPVPTSGSKADGLIELSYETGMFEVPVIDHNAAYKAALSRCQSWGYSRADAFQGVKTQCQARDGYGNCTQSIVTMTYQCI